ncbi:MAG: hypothetical protein D4R69_02505 [Actinomycetales bacterium]|nr:MAG: hypothetical protein D4R69_02505 [Actinomycetales bacterium]
MQNKAFIDFLRKESGSISVLISGLFLLVLTLSIGIIDVTDSYLAKRELIAIGEDAILVASHSLDENRYYSGSPNSFGNSFGDSFGEPNRRVPINCASAALKFSAEISTRNLRRNLIGVSGWSCSDDQITASISSSIQALVNFPIISRINGGKIGVNATIGATSEISIT